MKEYIHDRSYEFIIETRLAPDSYQSVAQIFVNREALPMRILTREIGLIGGHPVPYKLTPEFFKENHRLVFTTSVYTHRLWNNQIDIFSEEFQVEVVPTGLEFTALNRGDRGVFVPFSYVPARVDAEGQLLVSIHPLMALKDEPLDPRTFNHF